MKLHNCEVFVKCLPVSTLVSEYKYYSYNFLITNGIIMSIIFIYYVVIIEWKIFYNYLL